MSQPSVESDLDKFTDAERLSTELSHSNGGNPFAKPEDRHRLLVPLHASIGPASDTFSDYSIYSSNNENERRPGRLLTTGGLRLASRSPSAPATWKGKVAASWTRNKGLALVTVAQLFGVMMNVTTRLLEMDGHHGPGMHPFQVGV